MEGVKMQSSPAKKTKAFSDVHITRAEKAHVYFRARVDAATNTMNFHFAFEEEESANGEPREDDDNESEDDGVWIF